jgi:putative transposase
VTTFRFIAAKRTEHSIALMCRVLEVSRSGYHAWMLRPLSPRGVEDARLTKRICELFPKRRGAYGSPRIWSDLVIDDGERISRKRVERLMRLAGLSASPTKKWRGTTIRVPGVRVADDLVDRKFAAGAPNRVWVADITYLRTWQGWLHLAVVVDCFSRRVVGWALEDNLRAELVVDALEQALQRRRPQRGLVHHSDQGSQYVSLAFGHRCRLAGIEQSMGGRGSAYDNAVCESFFKTLKSDLLDRRSWPDKAELRPAVFDYIETFYNRQRRHSSLDYLSPAEYEEVTNQARAA